MQISYGKGICSCDSRDNTGCQNLCTTGHGWLTGAKSMYISMAQYFLLTTAFLQYWYCIILGALLKCCVSAVPLTHLLFLNAFGLYQPSCIEVGIAM